MRSGWTARAAVVTALLLAASSSAASATLQPGGSFADDDGNLHEANIEAIAAEGITKGCNPPANSLYCPSATVTRGQMAAFLVRALDLTAHDPSLDFVDDDDSIFEDQIERLATAGITRGCNPPDNDRYCPDDVVTRGQMAAFLVRALGYSAGSGTDLFTDDDTSVFENSIDRLGTAGVTQGCNPPTNTMFCPTQPVKRDQMATFLTRALGLTPITPPQLIQFGAGTHRVGIDIEPGVYRNSGDNDGCYWERLSGFSGEFGDILANNFDDVRQIVEILDSDAGFDTDADCGTWSNDLSASKAPIASMTGGYWLVGDEVAPGLWTNIPADTGCYWERLEGFSGDFDEIIANDFVSDLTPALVQIAETDVGFYADADCGAWTYLGP